MDGIYPDSCGETLTVEFTASDTVCGDTDVCSATFTLDTVEIPDPVVISCPADATEAACQTQAAIETSFDSWIADVSATGGCDLVITTDWDSVNYPDACGESLTIEFTATDTVCGDSDVCSSTFAVESPDAVTANTPNNETVSSCDFADQAAVDTDFAAWVSDQTAAIGVGGGCSPSIINDAPTSGPIHCAGGEIKSPGQLRICV